MRGTESSPIVQVTAAILENRGRVLIARRGPGDQLAGKWELPGGKVKAGESPDHCLARELQEEFDLLVSVDEFVGAGIHRYDHKTIDLLVYRVSWISGRPKARVHAEFRWASPGELKRFEFAPADMPFVRKLEKGEIGLRSAPAAR